MIAEFIGHGIHEDDNETCGNYVCSSLKNSVFTDITVFVAFIRKPGILELKPFIQQAISEKRNVTFFVGRNEFITSKEALELLLELGVSTYIYNAETFIYHPKVYLFEGTKNRIITGSSNLTKTGLFFNVECSLLLDFSSQDSAGMKVLNQLKDYFSPLLDFSDPNLEFVTQEHIDKLYLEGLIPTENFEYQVNYTVDPNAKEKKRFKLPEIGELGNLEISDDKPRKKYKNHVLTITDAYLQKWDYMFEKLIAYEKEFGTFTVKRNYADHVLQAWYIKQKLLYKHPELKMPKEHIEKLTAVGFYFGDGHKLREELIVQEWIELLKDAIVNNEKIIQNQSYTYKGRKLGTWLIGISQANKKGKKLDIRERIEATGFDYSNTSRTVENVIARLIEDLYKVENPNKLDWRTRFFKHINKKGKLDEKTIKDIEFAWEFHFHEKPVWGKMHSGTVDRTDEWRAYRKSEGKWFPITLTNNEPLNLYFWVNRRKDNPKQMKRIKKNFTDQELTELRNAGFPI
jgi:HKD family nuclease